MALKIIDVYKDETSYGTVTEPITLSQAKAWILVDYPDDDTLISTLITQSRKAIEDFCHISIVPKSIFVTAMQEWYRFQDGWNNVSRWDRAFYGLTDYGPWSELPYGPVSSVQSVTNTSFGNIVILAANTDYFLRGKGFQQIKVVPECETLLIQYSTPYYCPDPLQEAILNEIAFRYENRGAGLNRYAAQNVGASEGAKALAAPYQRIWI